MKQAKLTRGHGRPARDKTNEHGQDARAPLHGSLESWSYLNPYAEIERHERNLPHWQQGEACQFVTWRLADSLPKEKLDEWDAEKTGWLRFHPVPWDAPTDREYHERFSARVEDWLDKGHGECLLRNPDCAVLVSGALEHFDDERYELAGYVVMPNHVHALFRPFEGHNLKDILHSWKSFTAKKINALLSRRGSLWQEEYWDRIVRNERHLLACLCYMKINPVIAGLREGQYILRIKWNIET